MMNEQSVCSLSRSTDGGPTGQLFKFFKAINQINKSLKKNYLLCFCLDRWYLCNSLEGQIQV